MSKSSGEAIQVSYTVATLDARSKMSRMRMLLSRPGYQDGDALREAIAAELDNLTDVLTDAYKRVDGMVDDESYMAEREAHEQELADCEKTISEKDAEIEILQLAVEQYRKVVDDGDDAVKVQCASLIDQQGQHDAEIERMRGMVKRAEESVEGYRKASAHDAKVAADANRRMAAWGQDKTAAETADHYREKCNSLSDELTALRSNMRRALDAAYQDAGKSKVRREAVRAVEMRIK